MNKKKKIIIIVISTLLVIIAIVAGSYFFSLSAVSDTPEVVEFTVNQGDSKEVVAENLKNAKKQLDNKGIYYLNKEIKSTDIYYLFQNHFLKKHLKIYDYYYYL